MLWFYEWFFPAVWLSWFAYWQISATRVKVTTRLEPLPSRIVRTVLFLAAIALLLVDRIPIPWLYRHYLPVGNATFFSGAAVTVAGLLFSVWARVHLGANWSRSVTIKQNHELITTGPYRLVRHPIYTGILVGFLGSALAITQWRGMVALLLVFVSFWYKLRLEEKWMRSEFGDAYLAYARRTAALVPGIL
ncbi:MAG TPA: isoprenylcysteine carboxylmethyltransferase family protein [Acidobacteriaceae bacterium]|nr:isoprenylcysteine carboxylmethyltransferase family protein [Acidobacteriaceae bacterium]